MTAVLALLSLVALRLFSSPSSGSCDIFAFAISEYDPSHPECRTASRAQSSSHMLVSQPCLLHSVRLSGAFPERHLAHETTLLWQTLAGQVCLRPVSASLSQEGGLWPVEPPGGYEEAEAGEGGLVFCIWGRSRTCVATESGLVDKAHHAASPLDPVSVGLP